MLHKVCYQKNVLIIDGIRQSREILKQFAQRITPLRIDTSHHAPDIISKCEEVNYDIIFLGYDLGEDRKNGQQILEELRVKSAISRQCSVIMITAEVSQAMVLAALEHKPDEYLTKPYSFNDISLRLERCLLKKQEMSSIYNAMDNNDYKQVITLCNIMIKKNNLYKNECLGIISRQYYELKQYDLAEEIYLTYQHEENCQWAIIGLSKIALINNEYTKAKNYLNKLVEDYPFYLSSYDWLARTYELLKEPDKIELTLEKAVSVSPRSVIRLKKYADQCLINKNFEEATSAYRNTHDIAYHSIHRKPENTINFAEALLEYSDELTIFQIKQLNIKAFSALKRMTLDFKLPELKVLSLLLSSRLYKKVEDIRSSNNAFNEAERLLVKVDNEFTPKISLDIAKSLFSLNKTDLAENIVNTLVESNQDDTSLMSRIYKLYPQALNDKNVIEAQMALEVGTNLYRAGEYRLAIEKLEKANVLFPNHMAIKLNLFQSILVSIDINEGKSKDILKMKTLNKEFTRLSLNSELFSKYEKLVIKYESILNRFN